MARRRLAKECVYCGSKVELTRDHIPPRNLFSPPYPSDLLTVPCCDTCNQTFSLDDQYFCLTVASRQESGRHIEAAPASRRAFQRLARAESEGFRRAFLSGAMFFPSVTSGFLGFGAASFEVEFSRLSRVAERAIKGLFAHHWLFRLPDSFEIKAFCEDGFDRSDPEALGRLQAVVATVRQEPEFSSPREVLRYKFKRYEEDGISSVWVLSFLHHTAFFGFVTPKAPL